MSQSNINAWHFGHVRPLILAVLISVLRFDILLPLVGRERDTLLPGNALRRGGDGPTLFLSNPRVSIDFPRYRLGSGATLHCRRPKLMLHVWEA